MGPQTRANIFICLLYNAFEAPLANVKMERQRMARNAFNIGKVWNPVCCHSYKTVKLTLWSTFSRIFLPRIKHFWYKLVEISFFLYCHLLDNLHILETWVPLKGLERFENSDVPCLQNIDVIFLLIFKFASHWTIACIVSTTNNGNGWGTRNIATVNSILVLLQPTWPKTKSLYDTTCLCFKMTSIWERCDFSTSIYMYHLFNMLFTALRKRWSNL